MLIDPKIIEDRLKVLVGVKATSVFRAANMLTFNLGSSVEGVNYKGKITSYPAYSIHVHCVWRIVSSEGIVVGYRDFYQPTKELTDEEYDNWNYDKIGNNMFDVVSSGLNKQFKKTEIVVEHICADKYAGFSLFLSNGFELQVIPDHSNPSEYWRFLDNTKNDRHYVVFEESD